MFVWCLVCWFARPSVDYPDRQRKVLGFDVDHSVGFRAGLGDTNSEFLEEFSNERVSRVLSAFDMSARKIPHVGIPPSIWMSMTKEELRAPPKQAGDYIVMLDVVVGCVCDCERTLSSVLLFEPVDHRVEFYQNCWPFLLQSNVCSCSINSMNTGMIDDLAAAIAWLMTEDVVGGVGVNLGDGIIELERLAAMLDAERSRRLVAFDRSAEWSVDGSRSAASWIAKRTNANKSEVARRIHVARMVDACALTQSVWAAGLVTTSHVDVIAKTRAGARADDHFAEFEPELTKCALNHSPKDVALKAREWRDALDAFLDRDGANGPSHEDHQQRHAHFSRTLYGVGYLDARFDVESAEIIEAALGRAYERGHVEKDPRTPAQQRADALLTICRAYLAGVPATGNRPHALFVLDVNTISGNAVGGCHSANGYPVTAEAARRIACNANINLMLVDGFVPLAMGRTARIFTPHQYRAMVVRDGGCRMCGAEVDRCEAHHMDEWVKDRGSTDLDRGVLICRGHCHNLLHEGRWTIEGHANATVRFKNPQGIIMCESAPNVPDHRWRTKHAKRADQLDNYAA